MSEPLDPGDTISALDLYHFLRWQVRCLRATPTEFEQLFEEVAERLDSGRFMQIRAYGRVGDRKMDGVVWAEGTVYQVYSPDELKQSKLTSKMEEDLSGAQEELGEMLEEWIFVYNARRGAPPDVPVDLNQYQDEYPGVEISSMSEYDLWEKVRDEMSIQDRAEVLGGPPSGWKEYFGGDGNGKGKGRVVILHETQRPVDEETAIAALDPERPYGPPLRIRYSLEDLGWQKAATKQEKEIRQLLDNVGGDLARFAVFGLSHVPLLIHLGFLLTDRVDVRLFQFHRDAGSWDWEDAPEAERQPVQTSGFPEGRVEGETDVTVRVSLSARISPADTREWVGAEGPEVDLEVAEPDVLWLQEPGQLTELQKEFRGVLKNIRNGFPDCRRIHLFYAGPAPGAVALGQSINPTMNPPVVTYDYDHNRTPRYEEALTLSGL